MEEPVAKNRRVVRSRVTTIRNALASEVERKCAFAIAASICCWVLSFVLVSCLEGNLSAYISGGSLGGEGSIAAAKHWSLYRYRRFSEVKFGRTAI